MSLVPPTFSPGNPRFIGGIFGKALLLERQDKLAIPTNGILDFDDFEITSILTPTIEEDIQIPWAGLVCLDIGPLTGMFYWYGRVMAAWDNGNLLDSNVSVAVGDRLFISWRRIGGRHYLAVGKNGAPLVTLDTDASTPQSSDILNVGFQGSQHSSNAWDDLRISVARSKSEIETEYRSGEPLVVDRKTAYRLSFNGSLIPQTWRPLGSPVCSTSPESRVSIFSVGARLSSSSIQTRTSKVVM